MPASMTPRSCFHVTVPFMSKQNSPSLPRSATIARPLVAGVAEAWLAFTCRFSRGTPVCTARSHSTAPVLLSIASSRHVCDTMSSAGSTPALPVRSDRRLLRRLR